MQRCPRGLTLTIDQLNLRMPRGVMQSGPRRLTSTLDRLNLWKPRGLTPNSPQVELFDTN